jgi:predicted DNA-binding transcriptional regulator AlpA
MYPAVTALPPALESRRLLDTKQSASVAGYSVAHFRDLVRRGVAPQPVRLSARKLGWRVGDLVAWIDSKAGA